MDLGIAGRRAIVCGASAGLGFAIASALAQDGVTVYIAARNPARLEEARARIKRDTAGDVHAIVADVTSVAGRKSLLAACPQPDILINNAAGPPPGDFRDWERDAWLAAVEANMLSPILFMRDVIDGMIERQFGRIINITSIAVKQPEGYLGLSNGARAGLTGFVGGLARDVARHNVTINNVLPGRFDTDRLQATQKHLAAQSGKSTADIRSSAAAAIPVGRFGDPWECGALCAFLCSARAGFITGQNVLIDGGEFRGLF